MDRRAFLGTLTGGLLTAPLAAEEQQPGKTTRVGFLRFGPSIGQQQTAQSPLEAALRERGWVEGQNVVMERRSGESAEQLHAAAAELVLLNVDVLVVPSCGLAKIARGETSVIPIVIQACGYDLAEAGLVASLARPGGNITGSQVLGADLIGKRIELLKQVLPKLSRFASLAEGVTLMEVNPTVRNSYGVAADIAARTLRIARDHFTVRQPDEFATAFRGMIEKGDRAMLLWSTPFMEAHRKHIVDLAAANRIAAIYEAKPWVEAGGLMSYGRNSLDSWRVAAAYVDKILKGANPGDLPIEQPTKFELVINLKTAKVLGLTIPQSLLQRADQVIE